MSETTSPITLDIGDVQKSVQLIDIAATEGAYRGWALIEEALAVRNRINAFVETIAQTQQTPTE